MPEDPTYEYYETQACEYFRLTHQTNLYALWTKLSQYLAPNAIILDVGCGSGRDLRYFAQQGFRVIGTDYAFHMLQLTQSFSQQPIVLGNMVYLPFKQHTFDAVWSIGSLLHLHRHLLPAALAQIHNALKPGALFFSAVKQGQGERFDNRGRYTVFYLQDEWVRIMAESGFEVMDIEERRETRIINSGKREEIIWIECLTRVV